MKKIMQGLLRNKNTSPIPHILYSLVLVVFIGICIYEGISYFTSHYSFLDAFFLFLLSSIGYGIYNYYSLPTRTKNKIITQSQQVPFLGKVIVYREEIIYGAFLIVAGVFLYSFYFSVADIFKYAAYIYIGIFLVYTLLGQRVDIHNFGKTDFSQKTLLKIGVITLSIYLIFLSSLIEIYGASNYKHLLLLIGTLLYILGFLLCFTDTFSRIWKYFHSRKFKNYAAKHMYNFLSFTFISIAILLLLGKFGVFSGVGDKIFSYFIPPEIEQQIETPPEVVIDETVEPEKIYTTQLIGEVFSFGDDPLFLGLSGEKVSELQSALTLLGAFSGTVSGEYDEATKQALIITLQSQCDWPDTTQGIFGAQARVCINSLSVEVPKDIWEVVSDEAIITPEEIVIN